MEMTKITESYVMNRHKNSVLKNNNIKLWRNNVGLFYNYRRDPIRCGLCPGSADLIGFESIIITPEMLGKRLAVFRADEIKKDKNQKLSPQQIEWLSMCKEMGAIINVVYG